MSDFISWLQDADDPDTILLRDDGSEAEPAYDGERDAEGHLVVSKETNPETGDPVYVAVDPPRPAVPARPGWPEGVGVRVVRVPSTGDFETIQRLQRKMNGKDRDEGFAQRVTVGVLMRELVGDVFRDKKTGEIPTVPKNVEARVELAKRLPLRVIFWLDGAITREIMASPLPGSELPEPTDLTKKRTARKAKAEAADS